jgi:BlaI family transcriptional regulator, penicillinase repressor
MASKTPSPPRPTDAELEILTVLWSMGPATVRQVYEAIGKRRAAQYSTILKFLQIMTDKGLVVRDEKERAHVYAAARPREWTQQQLAGHLLDRAFSGSAKALLVGALSAKKTSPSELAEIRALLDDFAKRTKEPK